MVWLDGQCDLVHHVADKLESQTHQTRQPGVLVHQGARDVGAAGPHLVATTLIQQPATVGAPWTSRFATLGFGVGST